jgi:hypothetical protein
MWDWLGGLGDQAGALISDVIVFLQWLVLELIGLFQYLYRLLAFIFNFFIGVLQAVGKFFAYLWQSVIKPLFSELWGAIVKVHAWLESILSPIIKFLQQVRYWVNWFFTTYVKPFLNILSQIRQFLNVLKAFGVKWAAQLDAVLGKIQADVASTFLKINGYLNAIIGIVNSLADPLGLFRRPTFVMSMRRIFPSFARGISGMPLGFFFPSPVKGIGGGQGVPSFPLNFANTTQNPPPSSYLSGDDGLGDFGGVDEGTTIPDDAMDSMDPLDFFNDDLYPAPACGDPVSCLAQLQAAAFAAISGGNS